jgi:hypothetical protein
MKGDAIDAADTTHMDTIAKGHSHRGIAAHGIAVGLSEGLMGNSEVGHLNIGAGRIVWQDIVKIDVSIKKKQFHKNENILASFKHAKDGNGRLHLLGLVRRREAISVRFALADETNVRPRSPTAVSTRTSTTSRPFSRPRRSSRSRMSLSTSSATAAIPRPSPPPDTPRTSPRSSVSMASGKLRLSPAATMRWTATSAGSVSRWL